MLHKDDLDLVSAIVREQTVTSGSASVFTHLASQDGELWASDLWRLCKSAEIAVHAGVLETEVFGVLCDISEAFRQHPDPVKLVAPSHSDAWRNAVSSVQNAQSGFRRNPTDKTRAQIVGESCERLNAKGYKLPIGAFGPDWEDAQLKNACVAVENHISRLGGETVLNQLGGVIRDSNGIFEEIWLLGDRGLGIGQAKESGIPFGWLVGLAAKHMHRPNSCRKPSVAWRSMLALSRDVAASFDCQRYSQFEGMGGIELGQIASKMSEAIGWRALFFTPQAPKLLLPQLQNAFREVLDDTEDRKVKSTVLGLFREATELVAQLRGDGCISIYSSHAQRAFPKLYEYSRAVSGTINRRYCKPFGNASRQDTKFVLFDGSKDTLVVRPVGMTIQALCETVFGFIWSALTPKRAEKVVGDVIEVAIFRACEGKADRVWHDEPYGTKYKKLQIDVAARTGLDVTLIEAKAKSLTQDGQFGTSGTFYRDFAQSFLPMVKQLLRHDRHLKKGVTPLASVEEADELSVERIAVSPVSFGPIGDGLTITALITALSNAQLSSTNGDAKLASSISVFNKAVSDVMKEISLTVPQDKEGNLNRPLFAGGRLLHLMRPYLTC